MATKMTSEERFSGIVSDLERMTNSRNGNPRYRVVVGGRIAVTAPDCQLAYRIRHYEGKAVDVTAKLRYGQLTIVNISEKI